jgi:hypothetical protein
LDEAPIFTIEESQRNLKGKKKDINSSSNSMPYEGSFLKDL